MLIIIDNLKRHVYKLSHEIGKRDVANYWNLEKAKIYICEQFESYGYKVRFEHYVAGGREISNIIAVREGKKRPDEIVVVGAHYDSYDGPGADDNASGVAGILELARLFKGHAPDCTIKFIAFDSEEKPHFGTESMGSRVYAKGAKESNKNITAVIIFDSIGYYSEAPRSQKYPPFLKLFYPRKGNFVKIVSDFSSSVLAGEVKTYFKKHSDFPIRSVVGFRCFYGINLSDHGSFWKEGYRAIHVTDTAVFRNPTYHKMNDTWDTLDYESMSQVVRGFYFVLRKITRNNRRIEMTKSAEELLRIDPKAVAQSIEKYIRDVVDKHGAKGIALGVSGGLDSAVVAPLAVRALGKDRVHFYFVNSNQCDQESQDMARMVADSLGLKLNIESVEAVMREKAESASFFKRLSHLPPAVISALESLYYWIMGETVYMTSLRKNEFKDGSFKKWLYESMIKDIVTMFDGVSIERRKLLEGICKRENLVLIGAGNGSETKTGWFNIGGLDDMPYSPIGDLYKTQVRQLAEYLEVPVAIRNRKPIPDSLKGVTDESVLSMGYEKADVILYGIEHKMKDEEIMQYGPTKKEVERMRKISTLSEWKRAAGRG